MGRWLKKEEEKKSDRCNKFWNYLKGTLSTAGI